MSKGDFYSFISSQKRKMFGFEQMAIRGTNGSLKKLQWGRQGNDQTFFSFCLANFKNKGEFG